VISPEPTAPADADAATAALGARIRSLRQAREMTLAQAAAAADLSHSFLSQVERGLERLSMNSLFRIARALGTTQQALLTDAPSERPSGGYEVFRAAEASPLDAGSGPVTVFARSGGRFVPMMFSGSFGDEPLWWEHDEEEFVYVVEGELEMTLGDETVILRAGDSTYYEGGVRHRWRTLPGETARILVVKEHDHHG
jgi:quercetin dioxygenase-like cupin family protein/DNA-binding XRE family transcriptional regulator